jgi:dihydroorotate dehydrogenase (fumarate)
MSQSVDLSTEYLGLKLRNPIVASSCPSNSNIDLLKELEEAGIAAVVMPSLFEEQVEFEEDQFASLPEFGGESFAEAHSFFPELDDYNTGPDEYLRTIEAAREAVGVPIIGSLNGFTSGGWTHYARKIESAGAHALELNMYFIATDITQSAETVEAGYLELVADVKSQISIPLSVKIGPYFSSLGNFAVRLAKAGADGLILFNRFMQPDFDLISMEVNPRIELSHSSEVRLPLRWIAILHGQTEASLAATSGVHGYRDVIKLLMAGADATLIASGILRHGPAFVGQILEGMEEWMREQNYASVATLKGSMSYQNCPDSALIERANYMKGLTSFVSRYI